MNGDQLIDLMKFIFKQNGVPNSSIFSRWSLFANPIRGASGQGWVGMKILAYKGVDSSRTRATKMILNHALTCVTAGVASGATGLGALGSNVTGLGKFGGIKNAFGVDVGGIQLAQALKSKNPSTIENAIISSGKLLMYGIVRIDKANTGYTLSCRFERRPNSVTEWTLRHIDRLNTMDGLWLKRYSVWPNGTLYSGRRIIGNWKTGKTL